MTQSDGAALIEPLVEASLGEDDLCAKLLVSAHRGQRSRRILSDRKFHLELSLSGRWAESWANYPDHWHPGRWEPLGTIFLVPPGFEAQIRTEERRFHALSFEFDEDRIYSLFDKKPAGLRDWHLTAGLDLKLPALQAMMIRVAEEVRSPGVASGVLLGALAALVAVELVRHGDRLESGGSSGGLAPWQLRAIDRRLEQALRPPSVAELAVMCELSVRQLCRSFLASKGVTVGAYVTHHWMEVARRLLAGDHNVKEVADQLGFASPSNFCVAFRRNTGTTPGRYRRSQLKKL